MKSKAKSFYVDHTIRGYLEFMVYFELQQARFNTIGMKYAIHDEVGDSAGNTYYHLFLN